MSSHPGLDILREFTIADTSFSVISSRYIVLVLLFFMYDIGSAWFYINVGSNLAKNIPQNLVKHSLICFLSDVTTLLTMNFVCVIHSCFLFIISFKRDQDFLRLCLFSSKRIA